MKLANYLSLMFMATLASAGLLAVVAWVVNPEKTNWLGFALFYSSLFALVAGVGAILGFAFRFGLLRKRMVREAVVTGFRQALLLASLVVVVFYLFANDLFSWLNLSALVVGFAGLEFFFLSLTTKSEE